MLLHLPIVILATFSPVTVSDTVPKFDIVRECRFEGGSATDSTAALTTKMRPFDSLKGSGRGLSASTGGTAWLRRRSAVSRAMSNC
jgi:hypothetical protein